MRIENQSDYIDAVAQAVIDRIEEKERVSYLVDAVVQRVMALQKEMADAIAAEAAGEGTKGRENAEDS